MLKKEKKKKSKKKEMIKIDREERKGNKMREGESKKWGRTSAWDKWGIKS